MVKVGLLMALLLTSSDTLEKHQLFCRIEWKNPKNGKTGFGDWRPQKEIEAILEIWKKDTSGVIYKVVCPGGREA